MDDDFLWVFDLNKVRKRTNTCIPEALMLRDERALLAPSSPYI
jgi:hypothetical protein